MDWFALLLVLDFVIQMEKFHQEGEPISFHDLKRKECFLSHVCAHTDFYSMYVLILNHNLHWKRHQWHVVLQ